MYRLLSLLLLLAGAHSYSQQVAPLLNSTTLIQEGVKLHDEGKYKEAIIRYDQIPVGDSNYVLALYEKALSLQADSQFAEAVAVCKQGLQLRVDRSREPELYNVYGSSLSDMKNYDAAIQILDSGIIRYPAYTSLYLNKVVALIRKNDLDKAEETTKQALLIDPYNASLHYLYGVAAYNRGNIIPAAMAYSAYLLITPEGRYNTKAIGALSSIAHNEDDVVQFASKRTGEVPTTFQQIEQILASRIALDKSYKKLIQLDDPICRQLQVMMEKTEYDDAEDDFAMQYYVPLFRKIFDNRMFEPLVNRMFSAVNIDAIKTYNKKNQKELKKVIDLTVEYLNDIRSTRVLNAGKRTSSDLKYHFEDGKLYGYGKLQDNNNLGSWTYYYTSGNIKAKGQFNASGKREGLWQFYHFNGVHEADERYVNGDLEGEAIYFHDNGKKQLRGRFSAGKREGEFTTFYPNGVIQYVENFKLGNLHGLRKIWFNSGALNGIENYNEGQLQGPFTVYYKNGNVEKEGMMSENKITGKYTYYYENGVKAIDGLYDKGLAVGSWTRYHPNGKIKSTEQYKDDLLEGDFMEYHDNGQLMVKYQNVKGKTTGEVPYYDIDGKLYSKLVFKKDIIESAAYYDKNGKQISSSQMKGGKMNLTTYLASGHKNSEATYNDQGKLVGDKNYYFTSGRLKETERYSDGSLSGLSEAYYSSGKKRYGVEYKNGVKHGYYVSFYKHGSKQEEGNYSEDKAQGTWKHYYSNGQLRSESGYMNNKEHGLVTTYSPGGKPQISLEYYNGNLNTLTQYDSVGKVIATTNIWGGDGKMITFYVNGEKQAEGNYRNGQADGEWKEFYFDGSVKSIKYYRFGYLDSIYREYHYGGKISAEGQYKLGKQTGEWKYYRKSGDLSSKANFFDGELEGKRFWFFENGKKELEIDYHNGNEEGNYDRFDEEGNLMVRIKYSKGSALSYSWHDKNRQFVSEVSLNSGNGKIVAYYPNGNKSVEMEMVDDQLINSDNRYYSNGKIWLESTEDFDMTEGEVKYYYNTGTLKSVTSYLHNEPNGPFREYYASGKLKSEGFNIMGMNHGRLVFYNEQGQKTATHIYHYDQLLEIQK